MELVLGIESTCDETGVALVRGTELLADDTIKEPYLGVVS